MTVNQFLLKHGLTNTQLEVLVRAARYPENQEMLKFGVRTETLVALRSKGLIGKQLVYPPDEQAKRDVAATMLINAAYNSMHSAASPMQIAIGTEMCVWQAALSNLRAADELLKGNKQQVERITAAGRVVVAEYQQQVIGEPVTK